MLRQAPEVPLHWLCLHDSVLRRTKAARAQLQGPIPPLTRDMRVSDAAVVLEAHERILSDIIGQPVRSVNIGVARTSVCLSVCLRCIHTVTVATGDEYILRFSGNCGLAFPDHKSLHLNKFTVQFWQFSEMPPVAGTSGYFQLLVVRGDWYHGFGFFDATFT